MKGEIKWFSSQRGYGFITSEDGQDVFVHQSNIIMDGFRTLREDDIVEFELGENVDGRKQAVKVTPILTLKMVEDALRRDRLHLDTFQNVYGVKRYLVADENNFLQSYEQGMSLKELADYVGLQVEATS